nr:hypothetical protein [Clostridioides difficile]
MEWYYSQSEVSIEVIAEFHYRFELIYL